LILRRKKEPGRKVNHPAWFFGSEPNDVHFLLNLSTNPWTEHTPGVVTKLDELAASSSEVQCALV
jgi:hypothetical protein